MRSARSSSASARLADRDTATLLARELPAKQSELSIKAVCTKLSTCRAGWTARLRHCDVKVLQWPVRRVTALVLVCAAGRRGNIIVFRSAVRLTACEIERAERVLLLLAARLCSRVRRSSSRRRSRLAAATRSARARFRSTTGWRLRLVCAFDNRARAHTALGRAAASSIVCRDRWRSWNCCQAAATMRCVLMRLRACVARHRQQICRSRTPRRQRCSRRRARSSRANRKRVTTRQVHTARALGRERGSRMSALLLGRRQRVRRMRGMRRARELMHALAVRELHRQLLHVSGLRRAPNFARCRIAPLDVCVNLLHFSACARSS